MGGRGGSSHKATAAAVSNEIPKSLEYFDWHEAVWIDRNFRRYFTDAQIADMESQLQDLFDNHAFGMTIDRAFLENVIQEGFKNQFQTMTSGGSFDLDSRRLVSEMLFGHNSDNFLPQDYEKYGYLIDKDIVTAAKYSSNYGNTLVMFKKERLIDRTTYTIDDSLAPGLLDEFIGGSVKNASVAGLYVPADDTQAQDLYDAIMQASASESDPARWATPLTKATGHFASSYVELQFHGALTIDDIDSVFFYVDDPSPELEAALKARGIKVYKDR